MRLVWRSSVVVLLLLVALAISWLPWKELIRLEKSSADEPRPPAVQYSPPPADIPPPAVNPSGSPAAQQAPSPAADPAVAMADKVVVLVNAERASGGCAPLKPDPKLTLAATEHSQDMVARNYFNHTTPDGVDPWKRAKAAGYAHPTAENIAMGYADPASVVAGWMKSPGHRANIMNCKSKAVGVGLARTPKGVTYWTQLFGS
jgi:uncharacterized protein YkwD